MIMEKYANAHFSHCCKFFEETSPLVAKDKISYMGELMKIMQSKRG
jgi:hypothetical protein